jgi:hypothetical protein
MIVFNLVCGNTHPFEGWFASAAEFERQKKDALLSCPVCGSTEVAKALHAPHVKTGINVQSAPVRAKNKPDKDKAQQYANIAEGLTQIVDYVMANTEDVGDAFPEEARKIHYNEVPDRKIRGNASREQVKELREEGIEVIALPVPPHRLTKSH